MAQSRTESRTIDGHTVELTNLDKPLYPASDANPEAVTKAEVIDYLTAVADVMLPHLVGRPVTRKRWVDGMTEAPFFEKNLPNGAPEWIEAHDVTISEKTVHYPVFDSAADLVWAAQLAVLELHVPQWKFVDGTMGPATRMVFDLDPGEGTGLPQCAEVARAIRDVLGEDGVAAQRCFPVTSGSKGLHLYVALERRPAPGETSDTAQRIARRLADELPDLVTATMTRADRPGKVFIDWSQNNPAKTTVAPYSLRGRAAPTAAAPRTWAELDDPDLRQLRFDEVLARVRADGDLLEGLESGARA